MIEMAMDYSAQGLAVIPALPGSKEAACRWKTFQWQPPSLAEVEVMFAGRDDFNVAILCGAASGNLMVLDCETQISFDQFRRQFDQAEIDTWTVETSRGGHVYVRTPMPVRPAKFDRYEIRGQGQYVLAPPSLHPSGMKYKFINKPQIASSPSFDALDWLKLEPAAGKPGGHIPRRALALLQGKADRHYPSRSEAEQTIIAILVNAGFLFDQVISLFRRYPAAGKFAELDRKNPRDAERWLELSFEQARRFCLRESPERKQARKTMAWASSAAWPGRTGSTDRAVFLAHASLAYRSGREIYHASCRELAEIASCDKLTASRATRRLTEAGLLDVVDSFTCTNAKRYRISLVEKSESLAYTPPKNQCEGVYATSSFLLHEAFRQRGLGRAAFEIWIQLQQQPMTPKQLAEKTGRHIQTVRAALKKLSWVGDYGTGDVYELAVRQGKIWRANTDVDLDAVARAVGTHGARRKQQLEHRKERLAHQLAMRRNTGQSLNKQERV